MTDKKNFELVFRCGAGDIYFIRFATANEQRYFVSGIGRFYTYAEASKALEK